jgi:hypothetical protein
MSAADDIKRLAIDYACDAGGIFELETKRHLHTAIDALQFERVSIKARTDEMLTKLIAETDELRAERDSLLETQRKFGALMHKTMEERDSLLEALLWAKSTGFIRYSHRIPGQNETWCDGVDRFNAVIDAAIKASEGKAA